MNLKLDKGFRERLGYYAFGIAIGLVLVGAIFAARGMKQGQQYEPPERQPAGAATKPAGPSPGNPQ